MKLVPSMVVVSLVLLLHAPGASPVERGAEPPRRAISENVAGTTLTLTPEEPWDRAVVLVSGPDGFHATVRAEAGNPIQVDLGADGESPLADGRYSYELRLIRRGTDGPPERVHQGMFFVEAGAATSRAAKRRQLAAIRQELQAAVEEAGNSLATKITTVTDGLYIEEGNFNGLTYVKFDSQLEDSQPPKLWRIQNDQGIMGFSYQLYVDPSRDLLTLYPDGDFRVRDDDKPFFTVRPTAQVGIGTTAPQHEIHIFPQLTDDEIPQRRPEIFMYAYTEGGLLPPSQRGWQIAANVVEFWVEDTKSDTRPLVIAGDTQDNAIRISSSSIDLGTGLNVLDGEVTTDGLQLTSSRDDKEAVRAVDPEEVLERLASVPVAEWSFKDDGERVRHVGPMAEDFHAAFPLAGQSDKHLSVTDVQGVALAAIQGLSRQVERMSQRLDALAEENAELRALLAEQGEPRGPTFE